MILAELRHVVAFLRGRVILSRPGVCDRCGAVITELAGLKAETYGLVGEVTCPACENGTVRPAPTPADQAIRDCVRDAMYGDGGHLKPPDTGHIERAAAYYTANGDPE